MLNISKNIGEDKLIVKIEGRLDTNTAPKLDSSLKEDINNIKYLELDLSELMYISSAGLRVILATQKIMSNNGEMVVSNVQDMVMEVFEATGFSDVLTIQ